MRNLTINPEGTYTITGTFTRSQLADEYKMTEKRFRKKLKDHGVFLPPGILMPRDVKRVLDALGPPTIYGTFEP